ncbi:MAG: SpoIIE family protein phosphatase [Magnetococcales bacterium]|nr:SpoIIE family protein phosphatase [Magnetococcales bacterium]
MDSEQDRQPRTLLVVDDSPENITILKGVLSDQYRIRPAIHGRAALKAVLVDPMPDLILLDVMMPEMDGHEVCRQLKADPRTRDIPVIFITGLSDDADELLGLELGAVDYITKPIRPAIVRARVQTQLALRAAHHMIESQNFVLQEEREMIETIVLRMRAADHFAAQYVRQLYHPVEQTAGDLLLSAFAPDGRQLVMLGDFTGHGLPAAIGGPMVAYIFQSMIARGESGVAVFQEINNQLYARLPVGTFLAAVMVEVGAARQRANILNAAMPECLVIRQGAPTRRVVSRFAPLGVIPMPTMPLLEPALPLQPDEKVYLYSDGIIEAISKQEEPFGIERLERVLREQIATGAPVELILTELYRHCESEQFFDDVALIEIGV